MRLEKVFKSTKLTSQRLNEIFDYWKSNYDDIESEGLCSRLIDFSDERWNYDTDEEFLASYNKAHQFSIFHQTLYRTNKEEETRELVELSIRYQNGDTYFTIGDQSRSRILKVRNFIEENIEKYFHTEAKSTTLPTPKVFIGHGGSEIWRDLKDHLMDKHGIEVIAYETGARAGHTIRDILNEMMIKSSFAVLVMTAADEQADGSMNARSNVVHEAGLFQGKLGFNKAVVALEEGTNLFTNLDGIQQLRFSPSNIKEIFGDLLATIKREFQS